ncbi:type II 3-dehydroquinate dehydratase [Streptomyces sp. NPDC093589]|uniref:type II 3-dehydroquinate dehydratase n=1 Tax=Streptomyces sp. NPDC093589 TaxID=3366043 RepID=UPI003814B23B
MPSPAPEPSRSTSPAARPSGSPVLVLNGPNLNLLGLREPAIYGHDTLADVEALCHATAAEHGLLADVRQSNHEGVLIDAVQEARTAHRGIVINPAGYSHTSVALRDALAAADVPIVEVHLSNIHRREEFRHFSYVSGVADAVICGVGAHGYALALAHLARLLEGTR